MTPGEVGRMLASLQRIETLLETLIGLTMEGADRKAPLTQVPAVPLRANPALGWRRPAPHSNGVQGRR